MTTDEISAAIETLSSFLDAVHAAPESKEQLQAVTHLTLAHGYLAEYFAHVTQGCDQTAAIGKTISGELKIGHA